MYKVEVQGSNECWSTYTKKESKKDAEEVAQEIASFYNGVRIREERKRKGWSDTMPKGKISKDFDFIV